MGKPKKKLPPAKPQAPRTPGGKPAPKKLSAPMRKKSLGN